MNADQVTTGSTINPRRSIPAVTAAALAWLIAPTPVLALNARITNTRSNTVSVIDTATNTVIATVPVCIQPLGVAVSPDGSKVNTTESFSEKTNFARRVPIVYVACAGNRIVDDAVVSVIDTATNMVIASPPIQNQSCWSLGLSRNIGIAELSCDVFTSERRKPPQSAGGKDEAKSGDWQSYPGPGAGEARTGAPLDRQFVSRVLGGTDAQWQKIFADYNKTYEPPKLVLFSGATRSDCGLARSAMSPFYCPNGHRVYLENSFFQDLQTRFRACDVGSKACRFSQAYVIAHEVSHHVQNLLDILPKARQMQEGTNKVNANRVQVWVELQADCLAGVWVHHSEKDWKIIEPGDVEAAMQTASAIGDDRLQKQALGYVVPDAFTHGSSEQRTRWFMTGLKTGKVESCDTFNAQQL
jgi:YVTN family beta-propeller protein